MSEQQVTWERYVESWKVASVMEKRKIFEACLAPDCVYTDPLIVAAGWNALADYMVDFHGQLPGAHFVTEQFWGHHNRSVARWRMVTAEGTTVGDGVSYGEYNEQGKLVTMTGFFETPPPARAPEGALRPASQG